MAAPAQGIGMDLHQYLAWSNQRSAAVRVCPAWCWDDITTDRGDVLHLGAAWSVAIGDEVAGESLEVSLERCGSGPAVVRLQGSGGEMSPIQAFELAAAIQAAAAAALIESGMTR